MFFQKKIIINKTVKIPRYVDKNIEKIVFQQINK